MKRMTKLILVLSLFGLVVTPFVYAGSAYAVSEASRRAACEGLTSVGEGCDDTAAGSSITSLISSIVQVLSFVVGVAAVIMIILAGFKYITSGGDTNGISSAKNTLLYAIIGLLIVASAQLLVKFVFERVDTDSGVTPSVDVDAEPADTPSRGGVIRS